MLTLPEVFIYSSNIGSAKEADMVGIEGHREFLKRMGLLTRMRTELPEVATPTEPKEWKKVNSITIAFGHGMSTTPLQTAVGAAALMNGGKLIQPTFLPRTEAEADAVGEQVVKQSTVEQMRYLYELNATKAAAAPATGPRFPASASAARPARRRRWSTAAIPATSASTPSWRRFRWTIRNISCSSIIDEPKPEKPGMGATSGLNAAPIVANIIRRSGALLGVKPEFGHESGATVVSYQ